MLKYGIENQSLNLKAVFKSSMGHYLQLAVALAPLLFLMVLCKDANFLLPALNLQWIAVIQYLMQSFFAVLGFFNS